MIYFQARVNLRTWYTPWWNQGRNGSYSWTLERSNCLSLQACTRKGNSFCVCQKCRLHLYPFNEKQSSTLGPLTLHLDIKPRSQFPRLWDLMFFDFRPFLGLNFKNNPITRGYHFTCIRCCIWFTLCYIRSAVVLLGLPAYSFMLFTIFGLSAIAISDSILAIDVTLDRSKAYICFVYWSRHIYFTSWRQKSQVHYDHVLTLSTILCKV